MVSLEGGGGDLLGGKMTSYQDYVNLWVHLMDHGKGTLVRTSWYITPLYITVHPSKLQYDMLHSLLPKSTVSLLVYPSILQYTIFWDLLYLQYPPVYYSIPYCILFWVLLCHSTPQYITVYHTSIPQCNTVYHFPLPGPEHAAEGPGVEAAGASDPLQ